jgi:hypothetical protein
MTIFKISILEFITGCNLWKNIRYHQKSYVSIELESYLFLLKVNGLETHYKSNRLYIYGI